MRGQGVHKRQKREEAEHIAFADWVGIMECQYPELKMLFHVPNGEQRHIATAVKLKKMLVRSGVTDFIFLWPNADYSGMVLELKAKEKARLSVNQYNFIQQVPDCFKKVIAMGADEAIAAIKDYLGI